MNNFLFVHQCNREQYIITGLIESHQEEEEEAKEPLSVVCLGPLARFSFFRERKQRESQNQKKETGRPNFTNSQTDIGYMGEGGTAAAHSRQGRDVSEW